MCHFRVRIFKLGGCVRGKKTRVGLTANELCVSLASVWKRPRAAFFFLFSLWLSSRSTQVQQFSSKIHMQHFSLQSWVWLCGTCCKWKAAVIHPYVHIMLTSSVKPGKHSIQLYPVGSHSICSHSVPCLPVCLRVQTDSVPTCWFHQWSFLTLWIIFISTSVQMQIVFECNFFMSYSSSCCFQSRCYHLGSFISLPSLPNIFWCVFLYNFPF